MTRLILRFFDLLAPLLAALDVDYAQFRAILETKLILDSRRRILGYQLASQKDKKPGNAFAGTLVFYALMSLVLIPVITDATPVAGAAVLHLFVMIMVGLSLVADFSSILLDTTDNAILQPRPVSGRTILVARIAHIAIYLAALSLSLSLVPLAVGAAVVHRLYPLVLLPMLVCSVALVVFLANLLYLLAMRLVSGERLRDLLLYVQIGMIVLIVGIYQLMPRLMNVASLNDWRLEAHPWSWFLPPVWFAAPLDLLIGHIGALQLGLSLLAVLVPLAGLLAVVRIFAPRFNRALLDLDGVAPVSKRGLGRGPTQGRGPGFQPGFGHRGPALPSRLARLFCRHPAERAAFELIWLLCGRDRQFKFRTYPSLAIVLIMGLSVLLSTGRREGLAHTLQDLPSTHWHLYLLYMAAAMIPSTLLQLRFSQHYQAAWIYEALPIRAPGQVLRAALKAVLARFVLPAYLVICIPVAAIWGASSAFDIAFVLCAILFISTLEALLLVRTLPFSEPLTAAQGGGRVAYNMALLAAPGLIGLFHYQLGANRPLLLAVMLMLLAATWALARRYGQIGWHRLSLASG